VRERDAGPGVITVLAGTNGSGKSSIAGALLREAGGDYFNPDEVARRFSSAEPALSPAEANSRAWHEGKGLLERALREGRSFTFETTLGGDTITGLLEQALAAGTEVKIWYAGLSSPELHITRVRARVARGGHDIPEADIRRRYTASLKNLIRLLPRLTELRVFDNSQDGDPETGRPPRPRLLLHMRSGRVEGPALSRLARTPAWAKPVIAIALKTHHAS
jgi:predicted ABC-type ATPase